MKGIVFREFVDFIETKFGAQVLSSVKSAANSPAFESFEDDAEYDEKYLFSMVEFLNRATGIPTTDIVRIYGKHLFARLVVNYHSYLEPADTSFQFLQQVESLANNQIQQIYPDSHLKLEFDPAEANRMVMLYQSRDEYTDLTEGLLKGCIEHFGEKVIFEREDHLEEGVNTVKFSMLKMF
ncbi:MAG: heme NO-binding domain-containing protein [Calditrichia bacterium]